MSEAPLTKYKIQTKENEKFVFSEKLRLLSSEYLYSEKIPTSKNENWKYTRLSKIKHSNFYINDFDFLNSKYSIDKKEFLRKYSIPNLTGSVLVLINGIFVSELSNIIEENGISISSLSNNKKKFESNIPLKENFFNSLNTFYSKDGVYINISKKTLSNQKIQIITLNIGNNGFSPIRNIINVDDFSKAHIIFNHFSDESDSSFLNCISEINIGINSNLTIDKIQQENNSSLSINSEYIYQNKDSIININTFTFNGFLVRNDLNIEVNGKNSETNLLGVYLLDKEQHVDNHTIIDHKEAYCSSNELYKGVMGDRSTAVFNGKVIVRKDAQKINAFQSNANVLLSKDASVNSKPELEIYANDVKCSHGSTIGQLNEDAIYYLKTRGISSEKAKLMLTNAFIHEVIDKIEDEFIKEYIINLADKKLTSMQKKVSLF